MIVEPYHRPAEDTVSGAQHPDGKQGKAQCPGSQGRLIASGPEGIGRCLATPEELSRRRGLTVARSGHVALISRKDNARHLRNCAPTLSKCPLRGGITCGSSLYSPPSRRSCRSAPSCPAMPRPAAIDWARLVITGIDTAWVPTGSTRTVAFAGTAIVGIVDISCHRQPRIQIGPSDARHTGFSARVPTPQEPRVGSFFRLRGNNRDARIVPITGTLSLRRTVL